MKKKPSIDALVLKVLSEPRIVYGAYSRFATKIGVSRQRVMLWRKNGKIPKEGMDLIDAYFNLSINMQKLTTF